MRQLLFSVAALMVMLGGLHADESISWQTDFTRAKREAEREGKPLALFFTGSDWCAWCKKMEAEVFADADFVERIGAKFIFVKVDFPMHKEVTDGIRSQNERLKVKYEIEGYPTLIILDEKEQKIMEAGYRPGGGEKYADFMLKTLSEYGQYREQMRDVGIKKISSIDLEHLYQKARELGQDDDIQLIVQAGLVSDNPTSFLLEQYRLMTVAGLGDTEDARALRKQVLESDPLNKQGVHYRLAIVDFQQRAEALASGKGSADEACAPLIAYAERFGPSDVNNLWRVNMTIAQTYLSHGNVAEALKYAKASQASAPDSFRSQIADTVQELEMSQRGEAKATASLQ